MRDSLLRVIAPALPLHHLLAAGPQIGPRLREGRRGREPQMLALVDVIQHACT